LLIIIPPACIVRKFGNPDRSEAISIIFLCIESLFLTSCGVFAKISSSSFGNPLTFPSSLKIDRVLNVLIAPSKAVFSAPYLLNIYLNTSSLSRQEKSISKSGGLLRFGFRNLSKYKFNSIGSTSVIPKQ